jgi:hypothetical protein
MKGEHEAKMDLISALKKFQADHEEALEWLACIEVRTDRDGNPVLDPVWGA